MVLPPTRGEPQNTKSNFFDIFWESGIRKVEKNFDLTLKVITEVWILQGICPLKDEWVFGCSLKTRLADQTKTQQLKWLRSKDSMNSTINQRLVE